MAPMVASRADNPVFPGKNHISLAQVSLQKVHNTRFGPIASAAEIHRESHKSSRDISITPISSGQFPQHAHAARPTIAASLG